MVVGQSVDMVLTMLVIGSCYLTLYNFALGLAGLLAPRVPTPAAPGRLLVVVPAHNEAAVVADVVASLGASRYPRRQFHVLVLADHCTDVTAEISTRAGADGVVQRRDGPGGKQHAIRWLLDQLQATGALDAYRGVVVVDADNLVHPDLLARLNDHLAAGAAAVQASLDTRNPETGWIARSYAAAYWVSNLLVQRARYRLGLSALLGGTGMAIATWALRLVPFRPQTLVDDLEYTLQLICAGERVAYCEVPVYDEKPLTMRASIRQRTRWMRGQAACLLTMAGPLLRRAARTGDLAAIDQFVCLWNPVAMVVTSLYFLLTLPLQGAIGIALWLGFNAALNVVFLARAGVRPRLWGNAACAMVFSFSWIVPVLWGFATWRRRGWTHTQHVGAGMSAPTPTGGIA